MDTKAALVNWGRWARDRFHKQHCASLEHRYRSPQEWGDWEHSIPNQVQGPLDVLSALEMQRAISRVGFQFSWALTFEYCYPWMNKWKAAAWCKVYRPERLERLTRQAEHAIANILKNRSSKAYKHGNERTGVNPDSPNGNDRPNRPGRVFLRAA